jgi:hypothetical protein
VQAEMVKALGRPAELLFAESIAPLLTRPSAQGEPPSAKSRKEIRRQTPQQVAEVLLALEELVGKPEDDNTPAEPSRLARLARETAARIGAEWSQKLAELPVCLIEDPAFRLAGAEEASRLIVANVEAVLQHQEPLARDLAEKAQEAHDHLRVAAGRPARPGGRLSSKSPEQIIDLCRQYPKQRLHHLVLTSVLSAFVGLRGHLSDELREINFCRVRLNELQRMLDEGSASEQSVADRPPGDGGIGRVLYVSGCKGLDEAVKMVLETMGPERMLELDGEMEQMIRAQFTALVHVCLTNQSLLKPLERAMLQTAGDYVARQLPATSVASLFFEQHADSESAEGEAIDLYHQAGPEVSVGRAAKAGRVGIEPVELCVLATPTDDASEQFRQVLVRGVPQVEINTAISTEDILIYRERVNVALTDLEHLGPVGHDAYMQMSSTEHFTPHSRCDVEFRNTR